MEQLFVVTKIIGSPG